MNERLAYIAQQIIEVDEVVVVVVQFPELAVNHVKVLV
jgi:hypothetical protein